MNFSTRVRRWMRRNESGQSVILLAIGFVALVGFVGITTDISLMFVRYAQLSRAVDAAAIASANQMRQDRSQANLGLSARQFIELYGLNPTDVLVDTCVSKPGDADLCRSDQAKLVRVTAQIESPTVFMRLLGFQSFTLQAQAISETAALDVVVIMDVSESMTSLTTYEDWAKINLGVVYRPAKFNNDVFPLLYPNYATDGKTFQDAWEGNPTKGINDADSLLNTWQINVNNRLFYQPNAGSSALTNTGTANNKYVVSYDAKYFDGGAGGNYGVQNHPRAECRVRFFGYANDTRNNTYYGEYNETTKSYVRLIETSSAGAYAQSLYGKLGWTWIDKYAGNALDPFWDGFVPTYNYYGCCNDPNGDKDFSDLVCQPFKQARDALVQFVDRADFTRGDRMAIVTFDRTAFLINPYGYLYDPANATVACRTANNTAPECRSQAMMDNGSDVRATVLKLLGVRAEPNFYAYTPGNYTPGNSPLTANWTSYAAGVDLSGNSVAVDYSAIPAGYENFNFKTYQNNAVLSDNVFPQAYSYPVKDNCPFKIAGANSVRSLFDNGLRMVSHPNTSDNASWGSYSDTASYDLYGTNGDPLTYNIRMSYELWASCRGSNVGAGLREGNNALLNPQTIRQSGTIWVMIMLANGGAGASDPVRRNRADLSAAKPYAWNTATSKFGQSGAYGAFGVCPFGSPTKPAELTLPNNEKLQFPYCSDEAPRTRHFCNFRPEYTLTNAASDPLGDLYKNLETGLSCTAGTANCVKLSPLADSGYILYDQTLPRWYGTNGPQSQADELDWNRRNNNVYDVDLAGCNDPASLGGQDNANYYDVDDYAHDWADYIALRREGDEATLLPSIFTIGFGTEYKNRAGTISGAPVTLDPKNVDHIQQLCDLNVGDCLGEQVLRYISDVGDNNNVDNDWYEYMLHPSSTITGALDASYNRGSYGPRDPCQLSADNVGQITPYTRSVTVSGVPTVVETYDQTGDGMNQTEQDRLYGHYYPQTNCGNYYYAPDYAELQFVFDDIASRMFTRLSR